MSEEHDDQVGPESVEAGLREVLGRKTKEQQADESIIDVVERQTGSRPGVLLNDATDDPTPVLKMISGDAAEATGDTRYQILGEIARGGVGVVLKSRDKDLGRNVALKVLRKEFANNPDVLERFVEEAQIGGQLQHPGIVPVYGLGLQPDGRPFFAMKLVRGRTLSAMLEERKDPSQKRRYFLGIFEQIALTLAYAHARGVVHRDLKPSNVMVGGFGEVQVVDWGFAKVLGTAPKERIKPEQTIVATVRSGEGSAHSEAGSVLGTPAYMPPEQALGQLEGLDERADVFCLGGILCEILTGKPPYVGERSDLFTMAASGRVEEAYARLDGCGAESELIEFAKSCLAPAREDRLKDAGVVAKSISEQLAAAEESARQTELNAAEARAMAEEEHAQLAGQELAANQEEARAAEEERAAAKERARQKDEQRRADSERKARFRTLAIAGALILVVLVAGVGYLKLSSEADARARKAAAGVNAALEEASEREGEREWQKAIEAAQRAVDLAADSESSERAGAVLASLEQEKKKADVQAKREKKDREFVAKLEDLVYQGVDEFNHKKADVAHAAAFREYGCDVEALSVEEAVAKLRGSIVSVRLAAAMDSWAVTRMNFSSVEDGRRLAEIAKGIDPDPARNRMREAVLSEDREALLREARTIDVEVTPVRSLTLLGRGLIGLDEFAALREFMHRVHRVHPDDLLANLWLGYAYAGGTLPDASKAMPYFSAAMALRPGSAAPKLRLAGCLAQYALFDEALALCEQVLADQPRSAAAYATRCVVLTNKLDFEAAEASAQKALEIDPESQEALGALLGLGYRRGDPDGVLELSARFLEQMPEGAPNRATVWANKAAARLLMHDVDGAIRDARRAMELRPNRAAFSSLGEALRQKGKIDEAVQMLNKGIERFPESAWLHLRLALVYLQAKNWDAALAHCKRVREIDKAWGAQLMASYHQRRHELPEAIRYAREAIRLSPINAGAWNDLGLLHLRMGDYRSSIDFLTRYGELEPSNLDIARSNRAEVYNEMGEYDLALKELEGLITPGYLGDYTYLVSGTTLLRKGRYEEARMVLRQGNDLLTSRPPAARNSIGLLPLPELLRDAERIVSVAKHAGAIARDALKPKSAEQALAFATLCFYRSLHARAAALYEEAFRLEPKRAEDEHDRYHAAVAAAQAGEEWTLRARTWLQGNLAAWQRKVKERRGNDVIDARWVMANWRRVPPLAPVRDTVALASMSDSEREAWLAFWADVDALDASTREEN